MKIIHYIPALSRRLGGVAIYMQLLSKELGKLCDLIVVTRPFDNPLELDNCTVINLPIEEKLFKKRWKEILNDENPDLVHINGIWQRDTWWIQKEALRRNIRTYITPHGMLEPWIIKHNHWKKVVAMFLYEKRALRSAVNLIATAESEKNNILKLKVTNNEIPVIPNGIDISCIKIKDSWIKRNKILYISRIHEKKGIELFIDVANSMKSDLSNYEFVIAGEGAPDYVADLKRKASESELNFTFVGGVYGDEKWKMFQDADFFVLPTNSENFGYVIAESLSSGTPVITTTGAPWSLIEKYECGKWIERTKESLKEAIKEMIQKDEEELKKMGLSGRNLVEENFTSQKVAEELYKIYMK